MEKSSDVPGPTPTPGSSVDPARAKKGEKPRVRSAPVRGSNLRSQDAISKRALGAFTKEVTKEVDPTAVSQSSWRSTVSEVWNKLLELFDRIFANMETELTYQVRDAIVDGDAYALVYLLSRNIGVRDELCRHIQEDTELFKAIQNGQGDQFEALRLALGILSTKKPQVSAAAPAPALASPPSNPLVEPAPSPAPAPAPSNPPEAPVAPAQPFDAEAKAQELVSLKAEERGADGRYSEFVREVSKLNAEQLGEVFKENSDLLKGILPLVIQQIIQGKNASFRVAVLMHMDPSEIMKLLQNNSNSEGKAWALAGDILADIELNQLISILARIPFKQQRVIVVQHLKPSPQARLAGITSDQRRALLEGLNEDQRGEMEMALQPPIQRQAVDDVDKEATRLEGLEKPKKIAGLCNLPDEQLIAVLSAKPKLLEGFKYWEIRPILCRRTANCRATVLMNINPKCILPLYYDRNEKGLPEGWIKYVKNSIARIAPHYTMKRQLDDYYNKFYIKLAQRFKLLSANDNAKAKEIAAWKEDVVAKWDSIEVVSSEKVEELTNGSIESGREYTITYVIDERGLNDAVGMELVTTYTTPEGKQHVYSVEPFSVIRREGNLYTFQVRHSISDAGSFKVAYRMFPRNTDIPHRQDFCYVRWVY